MNLSAQLVGKEPCSIVWLVREDPYACRDRFFANSRGGKAVSVYDMVTWEVDYLRLLFPDARWNWTKDPAELAILNPDVLVFNSNTFTLDEGTDWAPRILVYLSDESGATPDVHRRTTKIPLVLRQYHHSHYVRATNVRQIPLGFMNTMFDDPYSLPDVALATQRRYRWCFVGGMKADRAEALEAFEPWGPSFCDPCPPHELARAYQASIFVPCPRGNVVMDCFRNYEATVCGAIPVVAGCSKREFQQNFAEVGVPPWIRARTWRQAQRICADLERTGAINELQRACLQWWRNEITAVQDAIADVLDLPEKAVSAANLSAPPLRSVLRWKLSSIARNGTGWRRRAARALTSIIG